MTIQERHTTGAQSIGYDYQFYYFMYLLLDLKLGDKIGFEVKDDIHIEKENEKVVLYQAKHTISQGNLTTLDTDLWKTLSNWADFIKADKNILDTNSFILVTNKNDNNNQFIDALVQFNQNKNIDNIMNVLKELKNKTNDRTIKHYIQNVNSLGKLKLKSFFTKLSIETSTNNIVEKVKNKILERTLQQKKLVDAIFEDLSANLLASKYLEIADKKQFALSFDDFIKKFGKCFKPAFENQPLPKRRVHVPLPDDMGNQVFIKQLIDVGDIDDNSKEVLQYTTQMLKTLNHFSYWIDENFVLPTEMENFEDNSILRWVNKFKAQYRPIRDKIKTGTPITELEDEIKSLGVQIVDYIREQDLNFQGYPTLEREFSNGHYYALSDKLKIGWHYDWENKYKKK